MFSRLSFLSYVPAFSVGLIRVDLGHVVLLTNVSVTKQHKLVLALLPCSDSIVMLLRFITCHFIIIIICYFIALGSIDPEG